MIRLFGKAIDSALPAIWEKSSKVNLARKSLTNLVSSDSLKLLDAVKSAEENHNLTGSYGETGIGQELNRILLRSIPATPGTATPTIPAISPEQKQEIDDLVANIVGKPSQKPKIAPESISGIEVPVQGVEKPVTGQAEAIPGLKTAVKEAQRPVSEPAEQPRMAKEGENVTKIANEAMDKYRRDMGLQPIFSDIPQGHRETFDKAEAKLNKDPNYGKRLLDSLIIDPRPISAEDEVIIAREAAMRKNEQIQAEADMNSATNDTDRVAARMRLERARDAFDEASRLIRTIGTLGGRATEIRKTLIGEDYSLVRMESDYRASVNDGKPLTPEQESKLRFMAREIERRQQLWEKYASGLEGRRAADVGDIYRLQKEVDQLRKFIADNTPKEGVGRFAAKPTSLMYAARTEPQRLDAAKKRLVKLEAELQRKIKERDFTATTRREPVELDQEGMTLKYNLESAKRRYNEMKFEDMMKKRSIPKKIMGSIGEAVNTSRALMTSFDISGVGRQGGWFLLSHPIISAKVFPSKFKAMKSEQGEFEVMEEIRHRKNAPLYQASGLELVEKGSSLSKMEEAYMSRLIDKMPSTSIGKGIHAALAPVRGSQRAYTTYLNRLRADMFDSFTANLSRNGKLTREEAKAIANYINVATGRGNMGDHANAAAFLATVFFAPRLVLSRFQLLAGQPLYGGTARTRILIAKDYARYLGALGTIYALSMSGGAEVESDSTSSDIGKLKFGNTRVDLLSGLAQAITFGARTILGRKKTAWGETIPLRGEGSKYGKGWGNELNRFLRSKLSPVSGVIYDKFSGETYDGKPFSAKQAALSLVRPMSVGDVYNNMISNGVPAATALSLLVLLGFNSKNYDQPAGFDTKKKKHSGLLEIKPLSETYNLNSIKKYNLK
jgi:hypothetical protein